MLGLIFVIALIVLFTLLIGGLIVAMLRSIDRADRYRQAKGNRSLERGGIL